MTNKCVFLDRDGTINVEKHYLYRIEDFEFLPGSIEALRMLQAANYKLIIITNQSGIARGYYTEKDFLILNEWMLAELAKQGVNIDRVYYCPHHPNATIKGYRINCTCRKPKTGLFLKAAKDYSLDLSRCFAIGDKVRDLALCEESDVRGFLIGENEDDVITEKAHEGAFHNIQYADDLYSAANMICNEKTRNL